MKALLLGSGAALHALVWKIISAGQVEQIYCAPGNAGTALLAGTMPSGPEQQAEVVQWAFSQQVDLVVVQGMPAWVDLLAGVGLPVLGAGERATAALGSRQGIRERLHRHGVDCLEGRTFHLLEEAERYLASRPLPLWLRPDHATLGEAIRVQERYEAFQQLARLMGVGPGEGVSIEAGPTGQEVALSLLSDGVGAMPFGISRPYDRRHEGDSGPMTEGMGAYAPVGDRTLEERLMEKVGRPVVAALAAEGLLRPAFLHLRIVLGEKLLLRDLSWALDDLHAAVILPRWEGDLTEPLQAAAQGRLERPVPSWQPGVAVAVAMVVEGYPAPCPVGYAVRGLDEADALVFHQATRLPAGAGPSSAGPWPSWLRPSTLYQPLDLERPPVTAGGRVLLVVGRGPHGAEARRQAYQAVERLEFPHHSWRRDIAAELA